MIQLSKKNIVSGAIVFSIALLLFTQTSQLADAMDTASIHPMDYPKVLLYILMFLGISIIFSPDKKGENSSDNIPLCSIHSVMLIIVLIAYALLLEKIGFVVTSFIGSCLVAYLMNWRNFKILFISNAIGIFFIWVLFRYILKIPLPSGMFF